MDIARSLHNLIGDINAEALTTIIQTRIEADQSAEIIIPNKFPFVITHLRLLKNTKVGFLNLSIIGRFYISDLPLALLDQWYDISATALIIKPDDKARFILSGAEPITVITKGIMVNQR